MRYALIFCIGIIGVGAYADTQLDQALMNGIQRGDKAAAKRALRQGADVNCVIVRDKIVKNIHNPITETVIPQMIITEKWTPLLAAIGNDDPAISATKKHAILALLLLQPDIQVDKKGQIVLDGPAKNDLKKQLLAQEVSPLYYALYTGKKEMADLLVDAVVDRVQEDSVALVDLAIEKGFDDIAMTLIHQGAPVPQTNPHDTSNKAKQIKAFKNKFGLDDPPPAIPLKPGDDGDVPDPQAADDGGAAGIPFMGSGGAGFGGAGSLGLRF